MKKITYKGFDNNFKCRDMQYKVGESYDKKNSSVKCCSDTGYHSCENPLDVFSFYSPSNSRFAECEVSGNVDVDSDKICSSKITINTEISIFKMVKIGVEYILSKIDFNNNKESNTGNRSAATNTGYRSAATNTGYRSAATNTGDQSAATNTGNRSAATNTGYQSAATNTGDQSAATNTGYQSAATNTGYRSAATNTGYRSAATNTGYQSAATNTGYQSAATNTGYRSAAIVEGDNSIAIATGYKSKAKGKIGCWLVLAEQDENYQIINVKCRKVDGKHIKADTFYVLNDNKFVISE